MPKKMHQKCTDPVSTHFYGRFSNPTYPTSPIPFSRSASKHKMGRVIFLPFSSKKCTKKGNRLCSSLLKMSLHQHSPFLISDSKIWFHRPKILVPSISSNHLFRPTLFRTMNDKSSSACVCGDDVAYLGGDVVSVSSAILCFAYLPRYSQSARNLLQALIHLLI